MNRMRIGLSDLNRIMEDAERLESFEESSRRPPAATPAQILSFLEVTTGDAFDVPAEQAIAYFRNKGLRPTFSYADMLREAHDQAFTIAKMMDVDLLKYVRTSLDEAMNSGISFAQWKRQLEPALARAGWWGVQDITDPLTGMTVQGRLGSPWRLETIFRTNMQSAYAVGQWQEIVDQAEIAPLLMYDAVDDFRTRPQHAAWDRAVLPVNHPWWRVHFPPNGYNCRCSVIQMTYDEARDLGLRVAADAPEDGYYEWTNPRTGEVSRVPTGIDPGFDRNPGRELSKDLSRVIDEKIAALPPDMQDFAREAVRPKFNTESPAGRWHASSFDDSPDWVRSWAYFNQDVEVLQSTKTGAYAQAGRLVEMNGYRVPDARGQSVWRHEFGHIVDVRLGRINSAWYRSSVDDYQRAQKADADMMKRKAGVTRSKAQNTARKEELNMAYSLTELRIIEAAPGDRENVLRALAGEYGLDYTGFMRVIRESTVILESISGIGAQVRIAKMMRAVKEQDGEEFLRLAAFKGEELSQSLTGSSWRKDGSLSSLSDLIGATTNNVLASYMRGFPGHSASYYRKRPNGSGTGTEAWANLTSLAGHPNPYWWGLAKLFAPEQAALFQRIMENEL